jgi:hypothetical protein
MTGMRLRNAAILPALALGFTTPAVAGPYSDDLAKCLVSHASTADHEALVRWMFAALAAGPAVRDIARATPEQRAAISMTAGQMFTRLVTKDCHNETVAALKYEGATAIELGFSTLGNVAARDMMGDPAVQAEMGSLDKGMDRAALDAINKEAGIAPAK